MAALLDGSLQHEYLTGLLEALLALALVAGLAYAALRVKPLRELLVPRGRLLQLEDTLRLDGKSALVVVRVEGRRLLLATHSQHGARLVTELAAAPLPEAQPAQAGPQPSAQAGALQREPAEALEP